MQNYSKLIAALVGLGVMLAARYGIDLSGQEKAIVDAVMSILTAFAVYQVPNKGPTA